MKEKEKLVERFGVRSTTLKCHKIIKWKKEGMKCWKRIFNKYNESGNIEIYLYIWNEILMMNFRDRFCSENIKRRNQQSTEEDFSSLFFFQEKSEKWLNFLQLQA